MGVLEAVLAVVGLGLLILLAIGALSGEAPAPSETRPRQKSEEMTSVALKCSRANVLLPEPDAPTSTTRLGSGSAILIG